MKRIKYAHNFSAKSTVAHKMDTPTSCTDVLKEVRLSVEKKELPPLLPRIVQTVDPGPKNGPDGPTIRLMQWNVLAQVLSQGEDSFVACPKEALTWEIRRLRVLEEILCINADVVCLQEVDTYQYFADILKKAGYEGMFQPKPDSPCLYYSNSYGPDGCAMFFKPKKLQVLSLTNVNLEANGSDTNQVALLISFKTLPQENYKESAVFNVFVTHLKAKPGYEKLREMQGEFIDQYLINKNLDHGLIICGDFNGTPEEKVYHVFKKSKLNLTSVYTLLSADGQEPAYTTWKIRGNTLGQRKDVCKTIDYIWLSTGRFRVRSIWKFPTEDEIGRDRLPSFEYPSDHLSMVCDLVVLPK